MSVANAYEQYMLELVNKERAKAGVQPLAFDGDLNEAAEIHSDWMLDTDKFSHTGSGGTNSYARMKAAGYSFSGSYTWGENIAWVSTRSPTGLQDEVTLLHSNLMNSTSHRNNILNASFREVGIGLVEGSFTSWNAAMVTQDFAKTGSNPLLLGVAFDDKDGDRSYDVGEGLGGATVKITNTATGAVYTATTSSAGGYDYMLAAGTYSVAFSKSGYAAKTSTVTIGTKNVKLDWIDPATSSTSTSDPTPTTSTGGLTLTGTTSANTLTGGSGNDTLSGLDGNDTLNGGTGADRLIGGTGSDVYIVDNSADIISEYSLQGTDSVKSSASYTLSDYVEKLTLTGTASINGTGSAQLNTLYGNSGTNILKGMGGNDTLHGQAGNDRLEGGDGNDLLSGGTGTDTLVGGAGKDRFDWNSASETAKGSARDIVLDFVRGSDKIDLSGIDADSDTTGNQAFSFIGGNAFSGVDGQLRYQQYDGTTDYSLVQGDTNGDKIADFEIQLNQLLSLQATDFVL